MPIHVFFREKVMCDLNIKVGSKILSVHKIVLVGNSTYFDKLLTGGFKESNVEEISLDNIEPNAIELIIDYIYTLTLKITEDNVQVIFLNKIIFFINLNNLWSLVYNLNFYFVVYIILCIHKV